MKIVVRGINYTRHTIEIITLIIPPYNSNSKEYRDAYEFVKTHRGADVADDLVPSESYFQIMEIPFSPTVVDRDGEEDEVRVITRTVKLSSESENRLRNLAANVSISKFADSFLKIGMCDGGGNITIEIESCDLKFSIALEAGSGSGCQVDGLDGFLEELDRLKEVQS